MHWSIIATIVTASSSSMLALILCSVYFGSIAVERKKHPRVEKIATVDKGPDARVVVTGLVRDCINGLPSFRAICDHVRALSVIVIENDSKDGSKAFLQNWMKEEPTRVYVFGAELVDTRRGEADKSKNRIVRMSHLRNQLHQRIYQIRGSDFDVVCSVDPDLQFQMNVPEMIRNIDRLANSHLLGISATVLEFGLNDYRDPYAYEDVHTIDKSLSSKGEYLSRKQWSGGDLAVLSAYGGLTLYNWKCIQDRHYVAETSDRTDEECRCEHVYFHKNEGLILDTSWRVYV